MYDLNFLIIEGLPCGHFHLKNVYIEFTEHVVYLDTQ